MALADPTPKAAKKKAEPKAEKADKADTSAKAKAAENTDPASVTAAPNKAEAQAAAPGVDVDEALAQTQAPREEPKVTEGSVRDQPHAVAQGAGAPPADDPVLEKVKAADTREEAAAKAEDPAGAGAGN
jgi:hypothetical protein